MGNTKADNQWNGKGMEQAINTVYNKYPRINPYPKHLTELEWNNLLHEAELWIPKFEKRFGKIHSCEWIGGKTMTESGDLIINGYKIEVKRVKGDSKATWTSTSWGTLRDEYGCPVDCQTYLKDTGLGEMLVKQFGKIVSLTNESPMTVANFEHFKHTIGIDKAFEKEWKAKDKKEREKKVTEIITYLKNNIDIAKKLMNDIATKNIIHKELPDYYVVWSYDKEEIIYYYDKSDLLSLNSNFKLYQTSKQKLGWFLGPFKINFRWQNEFTNPTITIFI